MTGIDSNNDRVGGLRSDDRSAGQGLLSPRLRGLGGDDEPSHAAVEMSLLWKSQNDFHRSLEISHRTRDSHIPTSRFPFFRGEERRMNRPQTGSLSERRTGLLSERRLQPAAGAETEA
jgi:hypothetical protein